MNEIKGKMCERVEKIEWEDINPDFYNIESPDINIIGFEIGEITLHYDDDGETAFYDVILSTDPFCVEISRKEGEQLFGIGNVEIIGKKYRLLKLLLDQRVLASQKPYIGIDLCILIQIEVIIPYIGIGLVY